MQTGIIAEYLRQEAGKEADTILRSCVHCGFCLATCPTYRLLGNELDSPRGRIYLIKQVLEGRPAGPRTRLHLDRCLTCLSCETTCPSGVRYHHLVTTGRRLVEEQVPRGLTDRLRRWLLRSVFPWPRRIGLLVRIGQICARLLPPTLARSIPPPQAPGPWPAPRHARRMLVLEGCVQPSMAPRINAATARVFDRLGIGLERVPGAGCCGAIHYHLNDGTAARELMRRNIDAWWPLLESGAEAVVITASGCGSFVKEYGLLLADDPRYAHKAARIAALTRDPAEILTGENRAPLEENLDTSRRIAFHCPCSLQHGQRLPGMTEALLKRLGFELTHVPDAHLCCGSAGTYSLLQKELALRLRQDKLTALTGGQPEVIATANIGCLLYLQAASPVPVRHWIELLDDGGTRAAS